MNVLQFPVFAEKRLILDAVNISGDIHKTKHTKRFEETLIKKNENQLETFNEN